MLNKLMVGVQNQLREKNMEVPDPVIRDAVTKFREEKGGMTGRKMADLINSITTKVIEEMNPTPALATRYVKPAHLEDRLVVYSLSLFMV